MNKKGAEMTVSTIIIIVLALIVLVVLVFYFTGGATNLFTRISSFFGGGPNVDSIVQACQVACTTNQKYEFCDRMRDVKFDEKTKEKLTCKQLVGENVGLEDCSSIDCGSFVASTTKASTLAEATEFATDCEVAKGSPKTTCTPENILLSRRTVVNKNGETYYCCKE